MIHAEVHTDDHRLHVSFDATPYFEQVDLEELFALQLTGWARDYPSDAIALFMLEKDAEVTDLFRFLDRNPKTSDGRPIGFECQVAESDVARWVRIQRPAWFQYLWPPAVYC